MTEAAIIERERRMVKTMVRAECRGWGDTENAMRRLETRYGLDYALQWSLSYRPPKDLKGAVRDYLHNVYAAWCEAQEKKYQHERFITETKTAAAAALVRAADALVGADNSAEEMK